MGKLFKIHCTKCDFTKSVREGSSRSLVDEYFTVSCNSCCNIENRSYYDFPKNRPVRSEPATGWWGRRKRQKELDDRYLEESAQWDIKLDNLREEALQQSCNQCGNEVHRVHFSDPFINPIPIDIGCPACKRFGCMTVCLAGMYD
jgi:hypothetical protein